MNISNLSVYIYQLIDMKVLTEEGKKLKSQFKMVCTNCKSGYTTIESDSHVEYHGFWDKTEHYIILKCNKCKHIEKHVVLSQTDGL